MSVELVGSTLGQHADDRATHSSVLGRVVVGDDLELLYRLRCRLNRRSLRDVAHVVGAIQHDLVGMRVQSIKGRIATAVGIQRGVTRFLVLLRATRGQVGQLHQVAASKGKIQDLLFLDYRGDLGRVGVDDGGLTGNSDLLGNLTRCHDEIDTGHLGLRQNDAERDLGLEARKLRPQVIGARVQFVKDVVPTIVADRQIRDVGGRVGRRDLHARDHRVGLVLNCSN